MTTGSTVERLDYLDGLRGVASIVVLFSHLVLAFYPYLGDGSQHYLDDGHAIPLAPLAMLWGGNFCVCLFFILSGFVLALTLPRSRNHLLTQFVKRLIRLGIPIFVALLLPYGLWRSGLFHHEQAAIVTNSVGWWGGFYHGEPKFWGVARDAILMPFRSGENRYNPIMWMMHLEYVGSFALILLYRLIRLEKLRIAVLLVLLALTFHTYYSDFVAGALLHDLKPAEAFERLGRPVRLALLGGTSLLALLFSAFSWSQGPGSNYFLFDQIDYLVSGDYIEAHQIGAMFLLLAILLSPAARNVLSAKPLLALGKQSFGIYLLHFPLLCSLGAWVFLATSRFGYGPAVLLSSTLLCTAVYCLSVLFTRYVDGPALVASRNAGLVIDKWIGGTRTT